MPVSWPSPGYADPEPYEINNHLILATGLVLTLPVIVLARPALVNGASTFSELSVALGETTGLVKYPLVYLLAILVALIGWLLASGSAIVFIHEGVHYGLGIVCGRDPRYIWAEYESDD